jgi:Rrf2 family protein
MIKLNRTTEYGLMALRYMNRKRTTEPQSVTSAREIADCYGFPFEITAKTLQRLKDTGLIHSAQGARGGYTIGRDLSEVSLAEFLQLMEGSHSVVACLPTQESAPKAKDASCACEYHSKCEIKHLMRDLNSRVYQFLNGIRLADLADSTVGEKELSNELKVSNLS